MPRKMLDPRCADKFFISVMHVLPHISRCHSEFDCSCRVMHVPQSLAGWLWCGLLFMVGPAIILLNNHVLNNVGYKYPIFFSSLGISSVAVLTHSAEWLGWIKIERTVTSRFWWTRILPIGLVSAATIATGNSVYLHLSVSFTQILKALTPVYILLCLVLFRVDIPSQAVVISVCIISFGTIIATMGEVQFSWTGFLLQSLADVFEGMRVVLLQMILSGSHKMNPVESLYFVYPATAFCQLVLVLIYEPSALFSSASWAIVFKHPSLFVLGIILGVTINVTGVFVIKHTSGLMLKLLGIIRNNFLVVGSVTFLGEKTTFMQMTGYIISIGGFMWYAGLTHGGQSDTRDILPDRKPYALLSLDEEEMDEL